MPPNWTSHPLGYPDLEDNAAQRYRLAATDPLLRKDAIRCCVRGCRNWLTKRSRRGMSADCFCPDHGISISTSPTYVFNDYRKNFIIEVAKLWKFTKLKVECWRLGNERSEDALSWNVFVGLARLNALAATLKCLTAIEADCEPELYLWGIRFSDDEPQVWGNLRKVRDELERRAGIPTEPDIILRIPGRVIVLIEAKFGSSNGTLLGQEDRFGDVSEFLDLYPCVAGKADPLNRDWLEQQKPIAVLQQLVRNTIFAQWLASDNEEQFVVNLVRDSEEIDVEDQMRKHLAADSPVSFRRCSWESLFRLPTVASEDARPLKCYLVNKTNKLERAFQLEGHFRDSV
jgi:hypothetical protein